MFLQIFDLYTEQKTSEKFRQADFTCYRGCRVSDEELTIFSQNVGGFVQMEGFLSLSLDKDIAVKFAINVDKEKKMP